MPASIRLRMLVADLDGTLLDPSGGLRPAVAAAVHRAIDRGVVVVLATARPPRSSAALRRELRIDTPGIYYNGALVADPSGEILLHDPIPPAAAAKVIAALVAEDPRAVVGLEILDRWYVNRPGAFDDVATARAGWEPDYVGPLDPCLATPVTKILAASPGRDCAKIEEAVAREAGDLVTATRTDAWLLQVMHRGVTKSRAAALIAGRFGVEPGEVMALGDSWNDVDLVEWAGFGVAMGNSPEVLRQAADAVVESNAEDGAARAVEKYLLGGA